MSMERKFVDLWNAKFDVKPPEWAYRFSDSQQYLLEDIEREISKREANIEQLEAELEQEKFLLSWLSQRKAVSQEKPSGTETLMNGECSEDSERQIPDQVNTQNSNTEIQDSTEVDSTHILEQSGSTEYHTVDNYSSRESVDTNLSVKSDSPVILRHRFCHTVLESDAQLARSVSQRLSEQGKYNSCNQLLLGSSYSPQASHSGVIRRSLSDPVKKLRSVGDVLKSPKKQASSDSPKERLESQEFEVKKEALDKFTKQQKISEDEEMDDAFDSEAVPIVGEKRSSNGIILDSLDTNKILALDDESDENELLSSMGSRAQRTRTPRNSIEASRIKMVRLSNGDLDSR